jgi:hypothetical protein
MPTLRTIQGCSSDQHAFDDNSAERSTFDRTYPLSEGREAVRYVGTGEARAKVVITADPSS